MTTLACTVNSAGITGPDYSDIFAELQNAYYSIYGADADLDADSQDGQFLAIIAQAIYDTNNVAIAVYNAYSPATAQGTALSSVVKINGLVRQSASNSTDILEITGTYGTTITGGQVGDNLGQGTVWDLPSSVTIPIGGSIEVTITCDQVGDFQFTPGEITDILTPTLGWQSASNVGPAVPGSPVETDAALRQRQSGSTALPSISLTEGTYAAVAAIPGVSEVYVYENDTDITDGNGLPPHSISVVVLGGNIQTIANTIAQTKSICTTYGATSVQTIDQNGVPLTINFEELDQVVMLVDITVTPLAGYSSTVATAIQTAVVNFINSLSIGETSYLNRLIAAASLGGTGQGATFALEVGSVTQAISPAGPTAADVPIAFNQQATAIAANVTIST